MLAGTLELQLLADVARIKSDMDRASRIVSSGASSMQKAMELVKVAMASVASGFAVATLVRNIQAVVAEWDELGKAAQRAGFQSAQAMGEFQYAAKLAGTDARGFETAMGKLSEKMADAAGGNKQAAALFAALGIQVKDSTGALRSNEDVLTDLARAFSTFRDGPEKSALAMDLFSKAGKDLIPLLNGGATGLATLRQEFRELYGVLDAEAIKAAEQFNDNLEKLKIASGALSRSMVEELLPALVRISDKMVEAARNGGILRGVWAGIAEFANIIGGGKKGGPGWFDWMDMAGKSKEVRRLADEVKRLEDLKKNGKLGYEGQFMLDATLAGLAKAKAQFRTELAILDAQKAGLYSVDASDAQSRRMAGGGYDPRPAAPVIPKPDPAAAAAVAKAAAAAKRELEDQKRLLADLSGVQADYMAQLERLQKLRVLQNMTDERYVALVEELIKKQPGVKEFYEEQAQASEEASKRMAAAQEEEAKVTAEVNEILNDQQKMRAEQIDGANELLEAIEFETQALTMTNVEREKAIALRDLERSGLDKSSQAYADLAAKITAAVEQREAVRAHLELWKQVDDTARDVWHSIFEDGENAFKNLGQSLKRYLIDMLYQMTVRPWLLNITAQMTGTGGAGGMVAGALGGGPAGGGGGFLQNIFGAGIQALTGASVGASGASLGIANMAGAFGGDALGTLIAANGSWAGVSAGAGAAGAAAGGLAGIMGTVGAALPWIGAAIAIASLFMGDDDPTPKKEGYHVPYLENANWSTRNDADVAAASKQLAEGIQAQYESIITAYGGTGGLQFGAGYITDPEGDAPTIARVGAGRDGTEAFVYHRDDIGRSEQELQAAIAEMGGRAVLQGLQDADLVGKMGEYLEALGDIATLTAETVTEAIAKVQKAATEKANLEEMIYQMTHTEEEKLLRARQQEIDAIDESNEALLRRVWQLQDEQRAAVTLAEALDTAAASSRDWMQFIGGINSGIRQYIDSLNTSPAGMLSSGERLGNAREQFFDQMRLARAGDRDALSNITQYADTFIGAQTDYTASGPQTRRTIEMVQRMLESLPEMQSAEEYLASVLREVSQNEINALLNGFESMDLNVDGMLSFDELQAALGPHAQSLIDAMDTNGDGQISRLELLSTNVTAVTGAIDANGDGQITELERLQAAIYSSGGSTLEGLRREFGRLDRNVDGLLNFRELRAALGPAAGVVMNAVDRNGDRQISRTELLNASVRNDTQVLRNVGDRLWDGLWGTAGLLEARFDQLDTTADGLLNFRELRAALGPLASDGTIRALMRRADTNNDGQLSHLEIINASTIDLGDIIRETSEEQIARQEEAIQAQTQAMMMDPVTGINVTLWEQLTGLTWSGESVPATPPAGSEWATWQPGQPVPTTGFANGGYHEGGWRWVGERGPELEFTGPARYYSAEQSARMAGGDAGTQISELKDEIAGVRRVLGTFAQRNLEQGARLVANSDTSTQAVKMNLIKVERV